MITNCILVIFLKKIWSPPGNAKWRPRMRRSVKNVNNPRGTDSEPLPFCQPYKHGLKSPDSVGIRVRTRIRTRTRTRVRLPGLGLGVNSGFCRTHTSLLGTLSKLLKRLFNTSSLAVIWTALNLYISSWAELSMYIQYPECSQ